MGAGMPHVQDLASLLIPRQMQKAVTEVDEALSVFQAILAGVQVDSLINPHSSSTTEVLLLSSLCRSGS